MTRYPQFGLPFDVSPIYRREDFVLSACNRAAYEGLAGSAGDKPPVLLLHGPEASGKTHLAHIWAAETHAVFIQADAMKEADLAAWMPGDSLPRAIVLDGLERLVEETALFHLLNMVREAGGSLLLVSREPASRLPVTLPDLRSRLNALPPLALEAPDDAALRAVLAKQFADRQLRVGEEVTDYLLARIDRSFASGRDWVERLDNAALAAQRKITIALARELLEQKEQDHG